ncbi:MAG: DUF4037 domain-containing protein [Ruminococcaceae bacterium]|nr:DUF4037 domain-containing protein [Oscillospiraceae bacterium]
MKGIELSEKFYYEYGAPMIKEKFPSLEGMIAVGLVGSGSECLGYDDDISQDHDFEPAFCMFIPDEDVIDSRTAFLLEREYSRLPKEFMGYKRSPLSPVGGNRHGLIRMSDFFKEKTGSSDGALSLREWFLIPEQSLAEVAYGKVFRDDLGTFTAVRERLSYLPEDVRLKKIAGNLLIMGQSGQYNYQRCISRGETAAAQLAMIEFAKSAMNLIFLLNKRYIPYYKWSFRAQRELPILGELDGALEYLISSGNRDGEELKKEKLCEEICGKIISALRECKLTDRESSNCEENAYAVNSLIRDGEIRNLHILYGV